MPSILGYGEDALTFWALTHRLDAVLKQLDDPSGPADCLLLFRPSFGRKAGPRSPQFGEFDFILASPRCVYLGEAKWDRSPEVKGAVIHLKPEQIERHAVFEAYYRIWISSDAWNWASFLRTCAEHFNEQNLAKPVPHLGSELSNNLRQVLTQVSQVTRRSPDVRNVLLITHTHGDFSTEGKTRIQGFDLVVLDASEIVERSYVPILK